jgi:hypothetical protein
MRAAVLLVLAVALSGIVIGIVLAGFFTTWASGRSTA